MRCKGIDATQRSLNQSNRGKDFHHIFRDAQSKPRVYRPVLYWRLDMGVAWTGARCEPLV